MENKLYFIFGIVILTLLFISCVTTSNSSSADEQTAATSIPFSRGVNFSGWFESSSAQRINFGKFNEQDFRDIKSLGADVIRLPINISSMSSGPPDYILDPLLLKFLDHAVDWAEQHEIYIILDNHPFYTDGKHPSADQTSKVLLKFWPQMATHFKDRGRYILYEILNEPRIAEGQWGRIQGEVIETIRKIDQIHTIIVSGGGNNSIDGLFSLPEYADRNLIYTFHFYDPFFFTHQGAEWASTPGLALLIGVPFPYDSKRMPSIPFALRWTWVGSELRDYSKEDALSSLVKPFDQAAAFARYRHVPVFCGEFGVYMPHSPTKDRIRWYKFVREALEQRKIPWTSWDYYGGFGLFNIRDGGDFDADLNVDVLHALGFTPPPQRPGPPEPLKSGFSIYDDYFVRGSKVIHWTPESTFNMYDTAAAEGEYAIRWGNLSKYDMYQVRFKRNEDFSYLVQSGYCLEFQARAEKPLHFNVWFENPENASSRPWRMQYAIDEKLLPPDGKWHTIRIPLSDMQDAGAWLNATRKWFEPQGKFSWKQVKHLTFSADVDCKDCTVWFDDIKIVK